MNHDENGQLIVREYIILNYIWLPTSFGSRNLYTFKMIGLIFATDMEDNKVLFVGLTEQGDDLECIEYVINTGIKLYGLRLAFFYDFFNNKENKE